MRGACGLELSLKRDNHKEETNYNISCYMQLARGGRVLTEGNERDTNPDKTSEEASWGRGEGCR